MKYLLIILAMILVLISIENAEKEAELKEIQRKLKTAMTLF